ncbi:acetyltransferase (GNAT) family protein [Maribacter spongiicola]|uniref:Acetyltransferase (GNAT) family protein n=1 Tax=Maribacter spongiicola TaxID=1206753 RepID=A0A4R7JXW2_9FLAO|nr:GNAT family N-acetyltransferase [Maribacter spongiicola]TDT41919.1 acetyltransferase (GNAT) family protein [Maribacter spongiicola]
MNLIYTTATTTEELIQILSLQEMNLKSSVSVLEMEQEGFLTVHHTLDILTRMNNACPHIIAKDEDKVVGYVLSMTEDFKDEISVLRPMFTELENVNIQNFITMGQICVAKTHRKMGIFRGLYNAMKIASYPTYDAIITEVDATNTRSLGAHYAVGFEKVCTYSSLGQDWELISLKTGAL